VPKHRLAVAALLPEPVASHVQAWRRALREPTRDVVPPHVTIVPPQSVRAEELEAAVALVERAAAEAVPAVVTLDGAGTFLPESPVVFLAVGEGAPALAAIEASLRRPPLDRRTHRFQPHVTIAQELPRPDLEQAVRDLAGFRASFPLREIALMEEDRGGVWRPLRRMTAGASPLVREVPFTEAASAAVFLLDPPRVLLGLRTPDEGHRYPGAWDAIGGKPDPGEPLLSALARETLEEAGVEPLDVTALGCFDDGERADAFYTATAWRGEPRNEAPSEHTRLEWVPIHEAFGRSMPPTVRRALARLVEVVGASGTVPGSGPS